MSINKFLQPGAGGAAAGALYTAGSNYGEVGDNSTTTATTWTAESSGWSDVTSITAQYKHSAIVRGGVGYVAGDATYEQLNQGNSTTQKTFVEFLSGGAGCIYLEAGFHRTHIIKDDGTLWGIGYNYDGCLGIDVTNDDGIFTLTQEASGWTDWIRVDGGYQHTGAIRNTSDLYTAGENGNYQLGLGDFTDRGGFTYSTGNVSKFIGGGVHSFILTTDGKIYGVGRNNGGQLGVGNNDTWITSWTQEASGFTWNDISSSPGRNSYHFAAAIKNDGSVWGWGAGHDGKNGVGDGSNYNSPQEIIPASSGNFQSVHCGETHSCAIDDQGRLWFWGSDAQYQDGDGDTTDTELQPPRIIDDANTWITATCGSNFTQGIY